MGSLFSILETELAKREEARFQKDSQMSIDVRKTIFERDLTYKIVYQVLYVLLRSLLKISVVTCFLLSSP